MYSLVVVKLIKKNPNKMKGKVNIDNNTFANKNVSKQP